MKPLELHIGSAVEWARRRTLVRFALVVGLAFFLFFAFVGAWSVVSGPFPAGSGVAGIALSEEETRGTTTPITIPPYTFTPPAEPEQTGPSTAPVRTPVRGREAVNTYDVPLGTVSGSGGTQSVEGGSFVTVPQYGPGERRSDLVAEITATGRYNPNASGDNRFIEDGTIEHDDQFFIQFTITNIGASDSNPWYYHVFLPVRVGGNAQGHLHRSEQQTGLAVGQQRGFTVTSSNPYIGRSRFEVMADPGNRLFEIDEDNNRAESVISVPLP